MEYSFSSERINNIKNEIEKMEIYYQIQILKIFNEYKNIKINENKSGIFINLSLLQSDILCELENFISYVKEQTSSLNTIENEKEQYKNTFFTEDQEQSKQQKHKDNLLFVFNGGTNN